MEGETRFSNPFFQTLLEEILKERNFKNANIKIKPGSSKGDNYLGVLYSVNVQDERNIDGSLNIIFKCMPESKARREQMRSREYFGNEVIFYNNILQEFLSFQSEKGVRGTDGFSCTPKCYRAIGKECYDLKIEGAEEVIVMDDMREHGYKMKDRRIGLDVSHCQLVMENLAKLHAFSFALRDQKPDKFVELKNSIMETVFQNPPKQEFLDYVESYRQQMVDALTNEALDNKYEQHMNNFMDNYYDIMLECVNGNSAEPYAVLTHGDCWTNNILFKYDKGVTEPTGMILLDFQVCRYASPVLDLAYFLNNCTEQTLRKQHYNHLLTRYYDTLAHFISKLGSDPQQLFPPNVFKEQLAKYCKYGFGMSVLVIPLFTSKAENLPDLDELFSGDTEATVKAFRSVPKNKLYNERICGVITDMVDLGYI